MTYTRLRDSFTRVQTPQNTGHILPIIKETYCPWFHTQFSLPCRTAAEFGSLGSGLNLDHLAELQADAVAKGALNMDRHVKAAAARGALNLERSQPLSNLEISALAQKVGQSLSLPPSLSKDMAIARRLDFTEAYLSWTWSTC